MVEVVAEAMRFQMTRNDEEWWGGAGAQGNWNGMIGKARNAVEVEVSFIFILIIPKIRKR